MFTITIIPIVHGTHIKIHNITQFPTLICCF